MAGKSQTSRAMYVRQSMEQPIDCECSAGSVMLYSRANPQRERDNQDAACVLEHSPRRVVLAIADGVGGRRSGAEAAQVTLDSLADSVLAADPDADDLRGAILSGLEIANERLTKSDSGSGGGGGGGGGGAGGATTVAIVEISGRTARPYHVGDSEILIVGQRGKVHLEVVPHSPVGYAVEAGLLDKNQALHHQDRHLVSNVVGSADMRIEVGPALAMHVHDTLVIGSDGLFDNLRLEEIVERVRMGPLADAAAAIVEACFERMNNPQAGQPSKPDDLTFILFRPHEER